MTTITGKLTASISLLALSSAIALPALAQGNEIIVTAQKREQSIKDVPIAITAVTEDYIESRNITNIQSLSSLAPNLKIENTPGNTTAAQISIRGGVTINPALTWEPTVGIYLNGSYIGKTQGSIFDVSDIERIEVLRGPQGTLYGRNTLGGAVNVITKKPSGEFGGSAKVGYGNYNDFTAKASVDFDQMGPFKVKVSGLLQNRDGFIEGVENPFPGVTTAGPLSTDELENVDKKSVLLAVSADASDNLTFDYNLDYSIADQKPVFSQIVSVLPADRCLPPSPPPFPSAPCFAPISPTYIGGGPFNGLYFGFPLDLYTNADRQFTATTDGNVFEKSEIIGHTLTATLDLGDNELKSITALRRMDWDDRLDLDGSPLPLAHTERNSDYDSFSQELQFTGSTDRLNYVLGGYYFSDDGTTLNPQFFFGGANRFDSRYGFETEAWAAYGQADFEITDRLTVTGGLRYTEETKSIDRSLVLLGMPDFTLIPVGTNAEQKFDNLSPQAIIDFDVTDDITMYAKYAKGFKSGGFNGEASSVAETIRPYDSEIIDSFEIGAKGRFLDNALQLNAALFFNKHKDMQLSVFTATNAASSDIRNAARANINGFELEGIWQVADRFSVRGSLGLLDPEYKEFIEFGMDVAGDRAFPHAPKTTFSAGIDAGLWQGDWGNVDLSADVNHSAKYFTFPYSLTPTAPQQAFNSEAPARTTVNARLAWSDIPLADNNVELAVWAKNLFDEEYLANFIDFGPGFGGLTNGYFAPPQTYGVTLGIEF